MAAPVITSITPTSGKSGDVGIVILGTDLYGASTFILKLYDSDFIEHDITSFVTYKSVTEIRFKVPPYVSDIYYVVVFTNEGASNVF